MSFNDLFQRGLSLDKLRAFIAVVRAGSVTAAAEGVASRRSLMSRQVSELEATLGVELFERRGRSLVLTEVGKSVAAVTQNYFCEFDNVVRLALGEQLNFRIGAGSAIFEAFVFPRIRELRNHFKEFNFEFVADNTTGILRALQEGDLDIGIIRKGNHGSEVTPIPCGEMKFSLVGRLDFCDRLSEWGVRQFLSSVPLAVIRGNGQFVSGFNELCGMLDVIPMFSIRTESFSQVRQLIKSGHPGGLLPREMNSDFAPTDYHIVDSPELGRLSRSLVVVTSSRASRVRDRLFEMASDFASVIDNCRL